MKALILAGGTGSRLRPLTHTSAKQLIPVANKPIIEYGIESICSAGITDFGVIIGENTGAEIQVALGDGRRWGIKITYILQDKPRGLAHAVQTAESYLEDEPFLMFLGDNIIRDGVQPFVERFRAKPANALILLSRVSDPQRFGVAEVQEGKVIQLVEKPKVPPSNLALVGVYLFDAQIFKATRAIKPSWRGELEITDAIQWLLDNGYSVESHLIDGWWKDTGKPEDLLDANRLILDTLQTYIAGDLDVKSDVEGRVSIGHESIIRNSVIRGPVVIGQQCRIENAFIGPFSAIGNGVTVQNAELENTVVLDGASITDVATRIDGSLLGRGVQLSQVPDRPRALRLVLGDNSLARMG